MKAAVVILNWNTKDYLRRFLPGVLASAGVSDGSATSGTGLDKTVAETPAGSLSPVEGPEQSKCQSHIDVIVADNGSTDGSVEVLREEFPQVRTVLLDKNYGFAGGYNKALEQIPEYDVFILLNTDIEVSPGWIEPLLSHLESHPGCAACSPKILSYADRTKFEYAGAAGGYLDRFGFPYCRGRILGKIETDRGQYDTPEDVMWVSGACMAIRGKAFFGAGGFDGRFFAHMEEIDLCWRLQLQGWTVTALPSTGIYHIGGGTLGQTSPFKLKLNFRNNLLMLSNNLAKTLASRKAASGIPTYKAASAGLRGASAMIMLRKAIDLMAAAAYLLTFKAGKAKAVLQAHREYRALKTAPSRKKLETWLEGTARHPYIKGLKNTYLLIEYLKKLFKIYWSKIL